MKYRLQQFGSIPIPHHNGMHEVGVPAVRLPSYPLWSGGSYVPPGRKPLESQTLRITGLEVADTMDDLILNLRRLRAVSGTRDQLWRIWSDGTREWTYAWIVMEPAEATPRTPLRAANVGISFFIEHPVWRAENETVHRYSDIWDADYSTLPTIGAASPPPGTPLTVTWRNGAVDTHYPVHALNITLESGTGTTSGLIINNETTGHILEWDGTIAPADPLGFGETLEIDTGAVMVENNGAGDYAHLIPPSGKTRWMELAAGDNTVTLTIDTTTVDDSLVLTVRYWPLSL